MLCMYMTPGGKPPGPTRATKALTGRTRKHAGPAESEERPRDTCVPERVSPSKDIQDGWVGMYRPLQGIID